MGVSVSDFQIGLIVLGVLFVFAVWMFNKAQERRARRSVEQLFGATRPDVLLGDQGERAARSTERTEPTLNGVATGESQREAATGHVPGGGRIEPALAAEGGKIGADEPSPMVEIDDEINATVLLTADQPVSGERILACLHGLRRAGRQTVTIVGASGDESWTPIRPGGRYDTVLVAVQLANRIGPLNEIEFSEFVAAVQHAADQIPASCDVPDMIETVNRARTLDARCAPLDTMIGINLVHPEGRWSGDLVAHLAAGHGMVLRADGHFHAQDANGVSRFTLQNGDGSAFRADTIAKLTTERLTFLLDVPQAANDEADPADGPFRRMAEAAQVFAGQLGAVLVDDNLRTLTPTSLAAIERQIAPVYARLDAEGMRAGSPRARALFG